MHSNVTESQHTYTCSVRMTACMSSRLARPLPLYSLLCAHFPSLSDGREHYRATYSSPHRSLSECFPLLWQTMRDGYYDRQRLHDTAISPLQWLQTTGGGRISDRGPADASTFTHRWDYCWIPWWCNGYTVFWHLYAYKKNNKVAFYQGVRCQVFVIEHLLLIIILQLRAMFYPP